MLTGTPLQNDLEELQNLLQFILPDVFSKEDINESADLQVCQALLLLPSIVLQLLQLLACSLWRDVSQTLVITERSAWTDSYHLFAYTTKLSYIRKLSLPKMCKCTFSSFWTFLQEAEAVQGLTERMKALLSPFVLRRLKSQVASQLTAKQQHEEVVSMTTEQAALYQKAVQQLRQDVAGNVKGVTATACGTFSMSLSANQAHTLPTIQQVVLDISSVS